VLSLEPGATSLVVALGAHEWLVGRTEADSDPGLAPLPSVGRVLDPDVERIAALAPELLLAWEGADTALLRRALSPDAVLLTTGIERLDDVVPTLARVAEALGPEVGERARRLTARWEAARRLLHGRARRTAPSVLWVVWTEPLTVAGPGSHVDDLLAWAGGRNAVASGRGAWPTLSWEAAAALDPEVVVWGDRAGVSDPAARDGPWQEVPAVAGGRVLVVPADTFHVPGLHSVHAAARLARRLDSLSPLPRSPS
jgi:iron complex transport system substrate-binding protein